MDILWFIFSTSSFAVFIWYWISMSKKVNALTKENNSLKEEMKKLHP